MEKITSASRQTARFDFDLDDLLRPAQAFEHPRRVVEDPDLTLNEKRAILASWASDACAIEAAPRGSDNIIERNTSEPPSIRIGIPSRQHPSSGNGCGAGLPVGFQGTTVRVLPPSGVRRSEHPVL
jgi:hypothetical protein